MNERPPQWRTSSYTNSGGSCVELADHSGGIQFRNSNRIGLGELHVGRASSAAFVAGCKAGQFDDLTVEPEG